MAVASRLHKTVSELIDGCTCCEIHEWIAFFKLQDQPPEKVGDGSEARLAIGQALAGMRARKARAHGGNQGR